MLEILHLLGQDAGQHEVRVGKHSRVHGVDALGLGRSFEQPARICTHELAPLQKSQLKQDAGFVGKLPECLVEQRLRLHALLEIGFSQRGGARQERTQSEGDLGIAVVLLARGAQEPQGSGGVSSFEEGPGLYHRPRKRGFLLRHGLPGCGLRRMDGLRHRGCRKRRRHRQQDARQQGMGDPDAPACGPQGRTDRSSASS